MNRACHLCDRSLFASITIVARLSAQACARSDISWGESSNVLRGLWGVRAYDKRGDRGDNAIDDCSVPMESSHGALEGFGDGDWSCWRGIPERRGFPRARGGLYTCGATVACAPLVSWSLTQVPIEGCVGICLPKPNGVLGSSYPKAGMKVEGIGNLRLRACSDVAKQSCVSWFINGGRGEDDGASHSCAAISLRKHSFWPSHVDREDPRDGGGDSL